MVFAGNLIALREYALCLNFAVNFGESGIYLGGESGHLGCRNTCIVTMSPLADAQVQFSLGGVPCGSFQGGVKEVVGRHTATINASEGTTIDVAETSVVVVGDSAHSVNLGRTIGVILVVGEGEECGFVVTTVLWEVLNE